MSGVGARPDAEVQTISQVSNMEVLSYLSHHTALGGSCRQQSELGMELWW